MALLMFASLLPGHPRPGDPALIRLVAKTPALLQKVLHVCLYGVLAVLLLWTFEGIQSVAYRFLVAFIIAVVFGAVMEWLQTRASGRFGRMHDVALNAAGAALGLLAAFFLALKP
jgi:VanZ family protein